MPRCHGCFSAGAGASTLGALALRVAEPGLAALGLADCDIPAATVPSHGGGARPAAAPRGAGRSLADGSHLMIPVENLEG